MNENKRKIGNKYHSLFIEDVPEDFEKHKSHKLYRIFISSFYEDRLEIRINSNGGYSNEGKRFYHVLQEKFKDRTTTILDPRGLSMGALLFCFGDKRIIYEFSEIMFHNYSGHSWGNGQEMISQAKHTDVLQKKFGKKILVDTGFFKKKEHNKILSGHDIWMGAREMCKRRIATHVVINGKKMSAKKYLKCNKKEVL